MRKAFPTRLTESFNEGIYNTKPLKERANRQWARGTLINGLVLRCASHGLLRLSDRINEHVVIYGTMRPLIFIVHCPQIALYMNAGRLDFYLSKETKFMNKSTNSGGSHS